MSNPLDQFKQTYITECFELLGEMEERLMALDVETVDSEALNAIFRCAHSIKGGSGAFGFDYITQFTHVLEALLDAMREGKVQPSRAAVDTLLKAADIVTNMVRAAENNTPPAAGYGDDIKAALEHMVGGAGPVIATPVAQISASASQLWDIAFTPHESLLLSGNEPLLILRELATLGEATITAHTENVPMLADIQPIHCYLRWSILLRSEKPESAIREVFEFVSDQCDLSLTPRIERRAARTKKLAQQKRAPVTMQVQQKLHRPRLFVWI